MQDIRLVMGVGFELVLKEEMIGNENFGQKENN